ncbi:hypothetical protein [Phenylobacterium sp. 58.2.17]|uniref:hypothetical protein n=1 Tax=Phenylobacterium sp. 58.2.17 TaxID=2969306 RepID=UPI0022645622|nr:hypothetical protein [Phenylobacterium sp. 58.2.17]MCX7584913.1 hypothetical protein [Phenylobacterium sp. 58.2.17]
MAEYWWVNHNTSHKHEIAGNFLWSPQRERDGKFSQFYENMRVARPGDIVLSYAKQRIGYVGRVVGLAEEAPLPDELRRPSNYWASTGWRLPVVWERASRAVEPKSVYSALQPLMPSKYSPLKRSKPEGAQKAYLARVGREVFDVIATAGGWVPIVVPEASRPSFEDLGIEGAIRQALARIAASAARSGEQRTSSYPQRSAERSDPLEALLRETWAAQKGACSLCGVAIPISPQNPLLQLSVDRIDSDVKEYVRGNVQITHLGCNLAKNSAPMEHWGEFFGVITQVAANNGMLPQGKTIL